MRWVACAALLLVGCDVDIGRSDDGGPRSPPRIFSSSPGADADLSEDGVLDFRVEGEDEDSLNLTWTFFADDTPEEGGDTGTGEFLAVWQMAWSEDIARTEVDVAFEVTDGTLVTDLSWVVTVE